MGRRISKKKWKRREPKRKSLYDKRPELTLLPKDDPRRVKAERKAGIKKKEEYIPEGGIQRVLEKGKPKPERGGYFSVAGQKKRFQQVVSDMDGIIRLVIQGRGYEMQREVREELERLGREEIPENIKPLFDEKLTEDILERYHIKDPELMRRLKIIIRSKTLKV